MAVTAEAIEAIDDPTLQSRRGWNLSGWTYMLVPWGVRFTHSNFQEEIEVRIEIFQESSRKCGKAEA
jgi:hypothetical protein